MAANDRPTLQLAWQMLLRASLIAARFSQAIEGLEFEQFACLGMKLAGRPKHRQ